MYICKITYYESIIDIANIIIIIIITQIRPDGH